VRTLDGHVTGWVPLSQLPEIILLPEGLTAVVLFGCLVAVARSPILSDRYPALVSRLGRFSFLLLGVALPAVLVLFLVSLASLLPVYAEQVGVLVIVLIVVGAAIVLWSSFWPEGTRRFQFVHRRQRLFLCSACGSLFQSNGMGPSLGIVGVPRATSSYLRCTKCGEWDWQELRGGTRCLSESA
jgi:MFS family permease